MSDFFVFTFLISIICFIVFLIKAKFRTKKFLLGALIGIVVSFVLIGVTMTPEERSEAKQRAKEEQVAKDKAEAKKKAKEEQVAKDKAEAEKKVKEEQVAKEKAEAEKKAKEEQVAKEKAEAEKKAKEEQVAKEKAEAEKKAKEEQVAKEKAEAEKKAKEQQVAKEKAEADRRAEEQQAEVTNQQQVERTVYVAPDSGTKFHYSNTCRGLKRANSIVSMSISEATAQGYELCGFEN